VMRERLAAALGVAVDAVSVKATTAEGMGAIGRAEGVLVQAIARVVPLAAGGSPDRDPPDGEPA